ncbi:MAG: DUF393 domain-containing protein [Bdellovibrionaceae bacterium]|nr:DUF393 domain-containing protein [Pseudobdellovibrionaceae bacterium]
MSFFLKRNKGLFYFAPLQGETARRTLGEQSPLLRSLNTLVVKTQTDQILIRSTAALYLFSLCDPLLSWAAYFRFVPRFLRDGVYRFISCTRHLWGKKNFCVLPTLEQQVYFLN